ncbi:MAG TPA: hypothetical protein PKA25_05205 [Bradyrhizobium sp.]|nr:hypothetical protein [Bradyrhizobium sp.]
MSRRLALCRSSPVKTLDWLATATPEQIAATVPEEYGLGDKALYIAALKATKETHSLDGRIASGDAASEGTC